MSFLPPAISPDVDSVDLEDNHYMVTFKSTNNGITSAFFHFKTKETIYSFYLGNLNTEQIKQGVLAHLVKKAITTANSEFGLNLQYS